MASHAQGSIAAFGYRDLDEARFPAIVRDIDTALQMADAQPRRITWDGDHIALIDRDGIRIALGLLPPTARTRHTHLVVAVGSLAGSGDTISGAAPNIHLADRLLLRIKDDLPYDTIMRGETAQPVDAELIWHVFEQLCAVRSPQWQGMSPAHGLPRNHEQEESFADFAMIGTDDVDSREPELARFLAQRAPPTRPLRLTVHFTGLMVMFVSAPLGAFMFTYSLLRDMVKER